MESLTGRLSGLSPNKRALLEDFLRNQRTPSAAPAAILPRSAGHSPLPLSFSQEWLWLIDQLDPGTPAYNMPLAVRLTGEVEPALLARIFAEIVRRHEVLRTAFAFDDGRPVQVVAGDLEAALPVVDLAGLPKAVRNEQALRLAREEARRSFDLRRGPLLRLALVRLGGPDHLLLVTMHHIVSDGWSLGVLLRELRALYEAFARGLPSPLPELTVQYADFALWQRSQMQGELLATQLDWWRQELAGAPRVLSLPTDRPRASLQRHEGGLVPVRLPQGLVTDLQELARRERATPFMVLLATFQALLHRLGGQEDVLVGTPAANRHRIEIESLIGFFVNTLVVRGRFDSPRTFRALLGRTRETALAVFKHQELPFPRLVEDLTPERDALVPPLVQVLFTFQNTPPLILELPGLALHELPGEAGVAKTDLTLWLTETGGGLAGDFEYDGGLFEHSTIERLAGHFESLLTTVVADSEQPVFAVPLLSPAERQALLVEWNGAAAAVSAVTDCMHWLFEAQVELTPDAVALICCCEPGSTGVAWTYRDLNRRANRLALRLRNCGVAPETLVGVAMERTPMLIVALLATLKAGGAYVPLDPTYPKERLNLMLDHIRAGSAMPVLLTEEHLMEQLPAACVEANVRVLCLNRHEQLSMTGEEIEISFTGDVLPENLAHTIYTSGSTGRPKGVMIEHRNAVALLHWTREAFTSEELAGVFAGTSVNFDLSVFELFAPLSRGGKVILGQDALDLAANPAAAEMTLLNTVPSVMAELLRMEAVPPSVKTVNLAGEPLRSSLVQHLYALGTIERVCNLYGPTEDTTYSTFATMEPDTNVSPTIGRPIAGAEVYVLDRGLYPVPVGMVGELFLAGRGLARGYLHRPELTAERFLPHLQAERPGERMYRTGDLVRYHTCGQLEFLGRLDGQVKIRGFRIELGEIEATLALHPMISEAVVTVREERLDDKCLVAYLACGPERPAVAELRRFLQKTLPLYMVPSTFVLLDHLPLAPNGKVDLGALSSIRLECREAQTRSVAPRDTVEAELAAIWEEVLSVHRVGVLDDFFALGGHSLLAIRLLARIEAKLGHRLPAATLFREPTIAQLADVLRGPVQTRHESPWVTLRSGGARPPLLCIQGVLKFRSLSRRLGPDQPCYALPVRDLSALKTPCTIQEIALSYVEQVRDFQPQGPYFLTGWCLGGLLAYEIAQQLQAQGQRVALLALFDTACPTPLWGRSKVEPTLTRPTWLEGLARKLQFHLRHVQPLAAKDKLSYARDRLHSFYQYHLVPHLRRAACNVYLKSGHELPAGLRNPGRILLQAQMDYVPRFYPGRIVLVLAKDRPYQENLELQSGWRDLAGGGLEVLEVPGNHETMFEEPHVELVARELEASLRSAID